MVTDPWTTGEYRLAIVPVQYEPVLKSCYWQNDQLMVCNASGLAKVLCPPVKICQKAIELGISPRWVSVQTSHIAMYASLPLDTPRAVLPETAKHLVDWGLEVIRLDRWFMNNDEVGFDSVTHFLDLCRPMWEN